MNILFKIENKTIKPDQIGVPAMNYGQTHRYKSFESFAYEIQIPVEVFTEKTSSWFKQLRKEVIEDAQFAEKGEFPVYDKYEEAGFPELNNLMLENTVLLAEIIKFNDLDVLNIICTHNVTQHAERYFINSLDTVAIRELVTLEGTAYKIR